MTLEPISAKTYSKWIDDLWLIDSKKYTPYYVVDGQQRLTTSILLIKSIINTMKKRGINQLNFTNVTDIERKFIVENKDENKSSSYLFCYERDNPSYSCLVNQIYCDNKSDLDSQQKTTYTQNLMNAISFFQKKLEALNASEIEMVYKKISQQFLFNTYEISSDIDVFVTFETMNNRGKPLSYLELLKNRLIYLSTLFNIKSDTKAVLRRNINSCWKDIYHILGQEKSNYLPDDEFLDAHFQLYFCNQINDIYRNYRKKNLPYYGTNIIQFNYLLEEYFVTNKIFEGQLNTVNIMEYIDSLKECIKSWYIISNPEKSNYSEEIIEYIRKINYLLTPRRGNRIQYFYGTYRTNPYKVLLLACLQNYIDENSLLKFLKSFERFLFMICFVPFECYDHNYEMINLDVIDALKKLKKGDIIIDSIREKIDKMTNNLIADEVIKNLISYYGKSDFYDENFIRYFLCEYELHLQNISKTNISKLDRDIYFEKGYESIEHIYPQRARQTYWIEMFKEYTQKQKVALKGSLGNFVAVSQVKNSRLANLPFPEKKSGKNNHISYKYGTYAEIELTEYEDWGAEEILARGLKLITFLQDRWGCKIGNSKEEKIAFLGLSFLKENKE